MVHTGKLQVHIMGHQITVKSAQLGKVILSLMQRLSVSDKIAQRLLIATIAAIFLLLVFDVFLHPLRIGHDQALHYQMGLLLLEGKVPFVDMYDSNPPMIYYIDTIPGAVAKVLHIHPIVSFQLFICTLSALSCAAVFWLSIKYARKRLVMPLLIMTVFYAAFNLLLGLDFGQREHICILAFVPFLLLRWLRWTDTRLDLRLCLILGLVAGIGICLKHYFLIIVVAVELYWLCKYWRWKRLIAPECIAAFSVGVLYLLHFLVVPPEMRDGFFNYMVPIYTYGYSFWDTNLITLFDSANNRQVFFWLPIACLAAISVSRRHSFSLPLIVYSMGGLAIYAIQYKGWTYHGFPCMSGMVLAGGLAVGCLIQLLSSRWRLPKNSLLAMTLFIALIAVAYTAAQFKARVENCPTLDLALIGYQGTSPREDVSAWPDVILPNTKKGDPILFFSNAVRPAFPATLQLERKPGSRFLHAIPLSLFRYIADTFHDAKAEQLLRYEPYMIHQYEEDIEKIKPRLIFIQIEPVGRYLQLYFFEQTALSDYDKLPDFYGFEVYKLKEQNGHS